MAGWMWTVAVYLDIVIIIIIPEIAFLEIAA